MKRKLTICQVTMSEALTIVKLMQHDRIPCLRLLFLTECILSANLEDLWWVLQLDFDLDLLRGATNHYVDWEVRENAPNFELEWLTILVWGLKKAYRPELEWVGGLFLDTTKLPLSRNRCETNSHHLLSTCRRRCICHVAPSHMEFYSKGILRSHIPEDIWSYSKFERRSCNAKFSAHLHLPWLQW